MAGPGNTLGGIAQRGEMFALQLGIWAVRSSLLLSQKTVVWTDLAPKAGTLPANASWRDSAPVTPIPKGSIICPNIAGVSYVGQEFSQEKLVPVGTVSSLWLLVPVPANATGSGYSGKLTVGGKYAFDIEITLNASESAPISNQGADDLWRMARLSWLDSRLGSDETATAPYSALSVNLASSGIAVAVSQHNRSIYFASATGPSATFSVVQGITVAAHPILSSPIALRLDSSAGQASFLSGNPPALAFPPTPAAATIVQGATASCGVTVNATVSVNYDGYLEMRLRLSTVSATPVSLRNITLQWDMPAAAARYAMGLGVVGRNRAGMCWDVRLSLCQPSRSMCLDPTHAEQVQRSGTAHSPLPTLSQPTHCLPTSPLLIPPRLTARFCSVLPRQLFQGHRLQLDRQCAHGAPSVVGGVPYCGDESEVEGRQQRLEQSALYHDNASNMGR